MHLTIYNSFIEIAVTVIEKETGIQPQKGKLYVNRNALLSDEVNVLIGITGKAIGNIIYSMDIQTATGIASRMMEEDLTEINDLVKSSIAELANVITGRGAKELENRGYPITISPPILLLGKGTSIENLDIPRVDIPLIFNSPQVAVPIVFGDGKLIVSMALKEANP